MHAGFSGYVNSIYKKEKDISMGMKEFFLMGLKK